MSAYYLIRMTTKRPPNLDFSQLAKRIVDQATGEIEKDPLPEPPKEKNAAAVALGKLGGKVGGKATAAMRTAAQQSEIGKKAAAARWKTKS